MSDDDLIRRGDALAAINKSWTDDELFTAIRALPAVQVTVKPPCSHINRDAQGVCWDCGYDARIRSALTVTPAPDAGKVQALVEAVKDIADPKRLTSHGDPTVLRDHARAALASIKETPHE